MMYRVDIDVGIVGTDRHPGRGAAHCDESGEGVGRGVDGPQHRAGGVGDVGQRPVRAEGHTGYGHLPLATVVHSLGITRLVLTNSSTRHQSVGTQP